MIKQYIFLFLSIFSFLPLHAQSLDCGVFACFGEEQTTNSEIQLTAALLPFDVTEESNQLVYGFPEIETVYTEFAENSTLSLDKQQITLKAGETEQLHYSWTSKSNQAVRWYSSDPTVATVNNGIITAKMQGEAIITVTSAAGTCSASCQVQVTSESIPEPTPNYYNIYVEDCEGTIVELTKHVVREGNSTSFTIEIEEGYNADAMQVTVKRGLFGYAETITPDEDGTYQIHNIWTDIYITIKGVEKEDPTGIETIDGAKVYTQDGKLYVETPALKSVRIVNLQGVIVKDEQQIGTRQYELPSGLYIICIGDQRFKVRI